MISNMNNFEFLRTILYSDSSEVILQAYKSLSNEGLEVYVEDSLNGFKLADESLLVEQQTLMVPLADWFVGKEILENAGLSDYVTEPEIPEGVQSEVEKAREQYFKKRKWTYIETAVIIVVAMLYYFFKVIFH